MIGSLGVSIVSFLFSSASTTVAELALVAQQALCGGERPRASGVAEAGILLIGIGFVVILFFKARDAIVSGKSSPAKEVAKHAAVGLAGGLVAIAKVWLDAYKRGEVLEFDISVPLFMLLVVVLLFGVAGCAVAKLGQKSVSAFAILSYRASVAVLIAGCAGASIQLLFLAIGAWLGYGTPGAECAEKLSRGIFRFGATSFFISAPMTAMLFALYAVVSSGIIRTRATASSSRRIGIGVVISVAIGLISIYAIFFFDSPWPLPHYNVYIFLMLQLPPVAFATLAGIADSTRTNLLRYTLGATLVAFFCASAIAWPLIPEQNMSGPRAIMFALAHGATALFTVWGVAYSQSVTTQSAKQSRGKVKPSAKKEKQLALPD